jgi:recombination protein RecA
MQRKVLDQAISTIQVRFGEQALVRANRLSAVEPWPCGVAAIDRLSGIGGLPQGRITAFSGPPTSGKMSLALALLAQATRELAQAVVVEVGQPGAEPFGSSPGFDPWAMLPMKPELDALTVVRASGPAMAGEAATSLARAGAGLLLLLGCPAEPDLAPLEAAAARSGTVVLAVVEHAPQPLAYASSLTLDLERAGWLWERGQLVGLRARVRCLKNKLAPPVGEADMEIRYPVSAGLFLPGALKEVMRDRRAAGEEEPEEVAWAGRVQSAAG